MNRPDLTKTHVDRLLTILEAVERSLKPSKLAFVERRTEVTTIRLTKSLSVAVQNLAKAHNLSVNAMIESMLWRACGSRQELLK
jgi:hypothetical protein